MAEREEGKYRAIKCDKADIVQRAKPLGPAEVTKALATASGFTSDKPFFMAVMQPSYVLRSRMVSFDAFLLFENSVFSPALVFPFAVDSIELCEEISETEELQGAPGGFGREILAAQVQ